MYMYTYMYNQIELAVCLQVAARYHFASLFPMTTNHFPGPLPTMQCVYMCVCI